MEALIDLIEILSNPKTMGTLHKSDEDIRAGRVEEISSVKELLREL
ncbi:MAG: hypothetical protein HXS54_13740 [Theionarchaea archaeon]|nr:hypothetical protein [Theionarchaea archaeon]